jgi:membrane-bound ClpP family serine protease
MPEQVAQAPPAPSPQKQFATMVIGIALVAIGAILINQGMNAVQTEVALILGVGLIAAGALLVFAGASRVWPGKTWVNLVLLAAGICLLVASGTTFHELEQGHLRHRPDHSRYSHDRGRGGNREEWVGKIQQKIKLPLSKSCADSTKIKV